MVHQLGDGPGQCSGSRREKCVIPPVYLARPMWPKSQLPAPVSSTSKIKRGAARLLLMFRNQFCLYDGFVGCRIVVIRTGSVAHGRHSPALAPKPRMPWCGSELRFVVLVMLNPKACHVGLTSPTVTKSNPTGPVAGGAPE